MVAACGPNSRGARRRRAQPNGRYDPGLTVIPHVTHPAEVRAPGVQGAPVAPSPADAAQLPSPLALTASEYARSCAHLALPHGERGALERYARLFREGLTDQPHLRVEIPPVGRTHVSESHEGGVLKFTQRVPRSGPPGDSAGGELEVESVLIPMVGRKRSRSYTLCVSSQVGCAMGCVFCQTAQMGLIRSLTAEEIVAQWFAARWLVERPDWEAPIRNIVFMGMGEPMDNLDSVVQAIKVLTDSRGPAMAMGRITVSTVGRVDGIARLAEHVRRPGWHRLGLAVSLNAPSDEVRSRIMPINRSAPLAELRRALVNWPFFGNAHLCLEYVLIPGVNDAPEHAQLLADYVLGGGAWAGGVEGAAGPLQGLVNVIPYNPRDQSPWPAPSEESVEGFMAAVSARGVYVKRRRTKGRDTMAACGQLGNPALRRRAGSGSLAGITVEGELSA